MIDRVYHCDFCGDERRPETLIGILWQSAPRVMMERPAKEVEQHICWACFEVVKKFVAERDQGQELTKQWSRRAAEKLPEAQL